jgi:hypothetical protein
VLAGSAGRVPMLRESPRRKRVRDGLDDKVDAVSKSIWETRAKANEAEISREAMREVLGSQTIRELVLK